jgi:hypothetical protein
MLVRSKVDATFSASGVPRHGIYMFTTERGGDDATSYSRLLSTAGIDRAWPARAVTKRIASSKRTTVVHRHNLATGERNFG